MFASVFVVIVDHIGPFPINGKIYMENRMTNPYVGVNLQHKIQSVIDINEIANRF